MIVNNVAPCVAVFNQRYPIPNTEHAIKDDIALVSLRFSRQKRLDILGIRPVAQFDAENPIGESLLFFYRDRVDILAIEISRDISSGSIDKVANNIKLCIETGKPLVILLYGENAWNLNILRARGICNGYQEEARCINHKNYLVATRNGSGISIFPQDSADETTLGASLRWAIRRSRAISQKERRRLM